LSTKESSKIHNKKQGLTLQLRHSWLSIYHHCLSSCPKGYILHRRILAGFSNGLGNIRSDIFGAEPRQEKSFLGTGGLTDATPLAQSGVDKNDMFPWTITIRNDFKSLCWTGINTHGTAITSVLMNMDDALLVLSGKLIIINNQKSHIKPPQ
jgi:hypothetical protein